MSFTSTEAITKVGVRREKFFWSPEGKRRQPIVSSVTIANFWHKVFFGKAFVIAQILQNAFSLRTWRTYYSFRLSYLFVTTCLLLSMSVVTVGVFRILSNRTVSVIETESLAINFSRQQQSLKALENFKGIYMTGDSVAQDTLEARQHLIARYLANFNSPFTQNVELIARQPHWKMILAISFAESTLGKSCINNNCSGIGGSNIVAYESVGEWVVALNKLIEKRYKNKTVEQMCGVYVQPCNPNWTLAVTTVLNDLARLRVP